PRGSGTDRRAGWSRFPIPFGACRSTVLSSSAARERQPFDKLRANGCCLANPTHLYAIAIGSNRPHGRHGRPPAVVEAAIARLDEEFGLFDASPIMLNPAHGGAGRDFANAVALVESQLDPPEMLQRLKHIEREFGRRSGRRWGPRVLDLDLALWSGGKFRSRSLTVPHPLLATRSFVLQPLANIAPSWRVNALTVRHLAHRLARRRPRG